MSRALANVVIAGFLLVQALALGNGLLRLPGGFPWGMFGGMEAAQFYLEAIAVTADGREVPIPLDEAFPYHATQPDLQALDQVKLGERSKVRDRLPRWLGAWMRARGVAATHVILRWRILELDTGRTTWSPITEIDLDVPPTP